MALSIGFRVSVSLHPAIQATGRLALALAGLAPASRTCLSLDTRSPDPPAPAANGGMVRPRGASLLNGTVAGRCPRVEGYSEQTHSAKTATPLVEVTPDRLSRETPPLYCRRTGNSWFRLPPSPHRAVAGGSKLAPRHRPRGLA